MAISMTLSGSMDKTRSLNNIEGRKCLFTAFINVLDSVDKDFFFPVLNVVAFLDELFLGRKHTWTKCIAAGRYEIFACIDNKNRHCIQNSHCIKLSDIDVYKSIIEKLR